MKPAYRGNHLLTHKVRNILDRPLRGKTLNLPEFCM